MLKYMLYALLLTTGFIVGGKVADSYPTRCVMTVEGLPHV